jgi:hypothetical protein
MMQSHGIVPDSFPSPVSQCALGPPSAVDTIPTHQIIKVRFHCAFPFESHRRPWPLLAGPRDAARGHSSLRVSIGTGARGPPLAGRNWRAASHPPSHLSQVRVGCRAGVLLLCCYDAPMGCQPGPFLC